MVKFKMAGGYCLVNCRFHFICISNLGQETRQESELGLVPGYHVCYLTKS